MASTLDSSSLARAEGTAPTRSVGRGATLMAANSWIKTLIQIGSLVVLGRILSPADYGLYGMVTAITGIAVVVGDLGLSLAALQKQTLSQQLKSNLFWVNVLVGTAIGVALAGIAPLLVLFYHQPKLLGLTMLLAVAFPVNGIAVQFRVELNRRGEFGKIMLSDVSGQAVGLVVAIAAAIAGWGYWALGLQLTVAAIVTFIGVAVRARWRPSLPRHADGLRGMLGFGANTLAVQAFNFISSNIDNVSVGRFLGATALGFYSRAWTLVTLPMYQLVTPLTRVVLPALSRLEGDEFRAALRRLQTVISYGVLAVLSGLAAVAPFFLEIVLGAKWVRSATILEVLTVGAAFQTLGYIYYWGFLSRARTGLMLLGELGGRIVMVVAIVSVATISPEAVAMASAGGAILIWAAGTFITGPRAGLGSIDLARQAARPFAIFVTAYLACKVVRVLWLDSWATNPVLPLLVTAAVWLVVVAAAFALPVVRRDITAVLAEVRTLRSGRGRSAKAA